MGCSCMQGEVNLQIEVKIQNDDIVTEMSTPNNIQVNQIKIQTPFFISSLKLNRTESQTHAISEKQVHQVISPIKANQENDVQSSENTAKEIIYIMSQQAISSCQQLKRQSQSKSISLKNKKKINMKQLEDQF
ncbi:hypothetical protein pb186bvf_011578 [Paramecium bursaria]